MDYGENFAIICLRLEKQTIKPTCFASIPASLYADALRKISNISGFLTSNLITSLHITNLSFTPMSPFVKDCHILSLISSSQNQDRLLQNAPASSSAGQQHTCNTP